MDDDPLRSLERAVRGPVRDDSEAVRAAGADASHLTGRPFAVVAPEDEEDVRSLVRWARGRRIPLVARGGGTSLDGESVPSDGAVAVDLAGWTDLEEVSADGRWARVGPGLVNRSFQESLRPHGLFFPPNPGSWARCTIGGNVATNASGPRSFRYGATRAWVRELDVVLGTGERLHLGTTVSKRSVGPDLLALFPGSEGTLGIITRVTARLAPLPAVRRGLVVSLEDGVALGAVAARFARTTPSGLSAVEYVDRGTAAALGEGGMPLGPGEHAVLLLEVEADDRAEADRRTARIAGELSAVGAGSAFLPFDDADEMWTRRGESGTVLDRRLGVRVREDVAVPPGRVDDLLAAVRRIAKEERVPLYLYGHLGEGSLHPNFAVDPGTPAADRIRARTMEAALALGGTISGEHGIGRLKRSFVERELGAPAVAWLWAVKRWCDPDGILNPGKLYPPPPGDGGPSRSPSVAAGT
ncbi:MAG TPA: FAD-binding oxidoreductase [Thermoplasmata archaeon]|nr:FAD-binding oxidoreductase [Thermoplasmata archaeon]